MFLFSLMQRGGCIRLADQLQLGEIDRRIREILGPRGLSLLHQPLRGTQLARCIRRDNANDVFFLKIKQGEAFAAESAAHHRLGPARRHAFAD